MDPVEDYNQWQERSRIRLFKGAKWRLEASRFELSQYKLSLLCLYQGKAKAIRYLNNINGDNELIISFTEKEWSLSINGHDVSRNFGIPLKHNSAWKHIKRARAISGYPIRRFTVTQNRQIPEWRAVNHDQCGFNYRLPEDKTDYLRVEMPDVFRSMELGMSQVSKSNSKTIK